MATHSIASFVAKLAVIAAAQHKAEQEALDLAATVIENRAKSKIGEYQAAAGPFAGWAELADSTKADRTRLGFSENDPLLRTGDLRNTIGRRVGPHIAYVGSDSDIAVYQELGTAKIPPRSFLGGAAAEKAPLVAKVTGERIFASLTGAGVYRGALPVK